MSNIDYKSLRMVFDGGIYKDRSKLEKMKRAIVLEKPSDLLQFAKEERTIQLKSIAIRLSPRLISDLDIDELDLDLIKIAVSESAVSYLHIPEQLLTEDVILGCLNTNKDVSIYIKYSDMSDKVLEKCIELGLTKSTLSKQAKKIHIMFHNVISVYSKESFDVIKNVPFIKEFETNELLLEDDEAYYTSSFPDNVFRLFIGLDEDFLNTEVFPYFSLENDILIKRNECFTYIKNLYYGALDGYLFHTKIFNEYIDYVDKAEDWLREYHLENILEKVITMGDNVVPGSKNEKLRTIKTLDNKIITRFPELKLKFL